MSKFQCIQRIFAADFEKIVEASEKYPNSFKDGIAVVTFNGVYTDNKIWSDYENYCTFARRWKEMGKNIQVNLSVTIGHGTEPSEKKYPMMVDHKQRRGIDAACPRSATFKEHLKKLVHRYAVLKPSVFWIDDDFRLSFHGKVEEGCFCEHCIKEFSERMGTDFTKASLPEMLAGDEKIGERRVRSEWQDYNREGMLTLAELIAKTVHSVDDGIIIGYMQVNPEIVLYEYPHFSDLIRVSKNKDGAVWFRHGSGFYADRHPYEMVEKNLSIARLCEMTEGENIVNLTEEVTLPYIRKAKSMQITLLEAIMNIGVAGADGIMDEAIKPNLTEQLLEGSIVDEMNRRHEYLCSLRALTEGKKQIGVYAYFHPDLWQYNDLVDDFSKMTDLGAFCWTNLFYLGIPITFRREGANVVLLSGKTVCAMNHEELKRCFSESVYMDGAAAEEVNHKLGYNITGVKNSSSDTSQYVKDRFCGYSEKFTAHALNGEYKEYTRYNYSRGSMEGNRLLLADGSEVLSYSANEIENEQGIVGTTVYENEYGGRVAVCCRAPWSDDILGKAKETQIKNIMDWLCRGKMPIRIESKCKVGVSVWEDETEKIVFLYNVDFDMADDVFLITNEVYYAEILEENGEWTGLCKGESFSVPAIPAWSASIIKLKK